MALESVFGLLIGLVMSVVSIVVFALISALVLWVTAKIFGIKTGFGKPLGIAVILGIIMFCWQLLSMLLGLLPVVGGVVSVIMMVLGIFVYLGVLVVAALLIKKKYAVDWGKALLIWLVWLVILMVVSGIMVGILAVIAMVFGAAIGAGALL